MIKIRIASPELYGVDCIDAKFVADQLAWLRQWQEETAAWQN